ncbi:MAG: hypothetical protein ACI4XJ_10065 [Eubacteriales bacterium]
MNILRKKNVSDRIIKSILDIVDEKSKNELSSEKMRKTVKLENLMIRAYLNDPAINYAVCRKTVQPFIPEFYLEDGDIRARAESMNLSERSVRGELAAWANKVVDQIYTGMAGDEAAIKKADAMVAGKYSDTEKYHYSQEQFVLAAMFECIPELAGKAERDAILKLGRKYSRVCLKNILNSIAYDIAESNGDNEIDQMTDISALRREVYLARRELQEYRELVEAADADFEDKLEELKQQEIASFFSALNNEKYGFLIDSLYLQKRAFMELKKSGEKLPYAVEGIPAFMDRLLSFLRDAGISPASRFAPHSTQRLTLEQMEGCRFEPLPERTAPIKEGEAVAVKVISSGWKLGNTVISYPVLQEDYQNNR